MISELIKRTNTVRIDKPLGEAGKRYEVDIAYGKMPKGKKEPDLRFDVAVRNISFRGDCLRITERSEQVTLHEPLGPQVPEQPAEPQQATHADHAARLETMRNMGVISQRARLLPEDQAEAPAEDQAEATEPAALEPITHIVCWHVEPEVPVVVTVRLPGQDLVLSYGAGPRPIG